MKAGDIYWLPMNKAKRNIAAHYVVILYVDAQNMVVYLQALQSGIFKIFENFGILNDNGCANCPTNFKAADFRKYLSNKSSRLDVDEVIFLNHKKYPKLLSKETFICYKTVEKEGYFYFNGNVKSGVYKYCGALQCVNKKQTAVAVRFSSQLSVVDKSLILESL